MQPIDFEAAKEVGKHLKYKITLWEGEGRLTIEYLKTDDSDVDLDKILAELAYQFAGLHQMMFHMQGEIESHRLPTM